MSTEPLGEPTSNESRVLLLPPTQRDAEVISKVLAAANIECVVCPDMTVLCNEVSRGLAAVLVSEEALLATPDRLISCVHSQPVWSDLSTIVLSRSGAELPKLSAVLPYLGNVTVVERPVRITTLLSLVRLCLRGRERQYQVREQMARQQGSELELRSSEERLLLAVQTGKLGVWELDLNSNEMVCSAECRKNYGRNSDDQFSYEDLWRSVHADDLQRAQADVTRSVTELSDYDTEYRTVWPDGSTHWVLVRGRPAPSKGGHAERLVGVTLDITERKLAEEQRAALLEAERAARSEAERAGQMKDEFLATLSHELRTPLNAILGWSQVLSLRAPTGEELAEGLRTIERNARAQTQIIEDLLDMSRIISGKVRLQVQQVSLAPVVQGSVDTMKPAIDAKQIKIEVVLDQLIGVVSGDSNRLQQVFWNLLSNAVKFTPRGGTIRVTLQQKNSYFEVRITDSGEGIDAQFLPRVFDRFRQADASTTRRHGGLGLGLAIVRQIVDLHGGKVSAESEGLGKGTTFTVALPMLTANELLHVTAEQPVQRVTTSTVMADVAEDVYGVKVLVVDDEPDSRALVKRLLEDAHAVVTAAGSAKEAFALLQTARPDVIVSDIGMPEEDGYGLIKRVRALSANNGGATPAVAVTAYARAEDRVHAIRAGFQHHLSKPIEPAELIA
ncbi:MAG: ATP-binding protein, partial [Gemmatimonadaceae bacterium]